MFALALCPVWMSSFLQAVAPLACVQLLEYSPHVKVSAHAILYIWDVFLFLTPSLPPQILALI